MKLSSMAILFVAVGALMIPAMPAAMANPGVSIGGVPTSIVSGGITQIVITAVSDTDGLEVTVYDQATVPAGVDGSCPLPVVGGGVSQWELRNPADTFDIRYNLPSPTDTMSAPFGTGLTEPFPVTTSTSAKVTNDGTDPSTSGTAADSVMAIWVDVTNGLPASSSSRPATTFYIILSCGSDLFGPYEDDGFFQIVKPVGGHVIPISTTALLLAGFSMSAVWMVPAIVATAGAGLVIYKFHKKKE